MYGENIYAASISSIEPPLHSESKQPTISDFCSTDLQKKDSAFLSSVAFL